ncbi:hypothetical protein ACIA5D_39500 [Actinoplanes sp. NPDC051513]|uniref:hypothetical protein n=1 Tax=Actinoplanes sp. NPDC051513 TaxID=3363908 RepID=UPI0037BA02D6
MASCTDSVSATAAAAAASSPQKTSTGVWELRASATSLSAPARRAISAWRWANTYAPSSSQTSMATTQPCHNRRS